MKSIKTIGLVALAALTAMALVGVSSAMAEGSTALCKVDESPCEAANQVKHVHEETLKGALAKLLTSAGTIECDVLFLGDVLELANPQVIHGNFTYTNCTRGPEKCTVKEVSKDSLLKVLKLGHEKADVTYVFEVHVACGPFFLCTYNGEVNGEAVGPLLSKELRGEVKLEEQEIHKVVGSFACPALGKLDILTTPLEAGPHTYIST